MTMGTLRQRKSKIKQGNTVANEISDYCLHCFEAVTDWFMDFGMIKSQISRGYVSCTYNHISYSLATGALSRGFSPILARVFYHCLSVSPSSALINNLAAILSDIPWVNTQYSQAGG